MSDDQPKKSKRGSSIPAADVQPETQPEGTAPAPVYVSKYGKGYKPDTHDISKDQTIRHLLGAQIGQLSADAMDMEQFIGGVMGVKNQVNTSRCVAFALARIAQLRCAVTGVPLKEFPSVDGLYTVGRAEERAAEGKKPEDQPLTDDGSVPSMMVKGANEFGVASESQWPSDDLSKLNDEPKLDELMSASQMKFPGSYRITSTGAQRMQDVRQAIAANYPVLIGVVVDQAFEEYDGGVAEPTVTPPIPVAVNAPVLAKAQGRHGLCLFGYKTFSNGLVLVRGCNSWGEEWGDFGLFWASAAWLQDDNVMDILVITCDPSHHAVDV